MCLKIQFCIQTRFRTLHIHKNVKIVVPLCIPIVQREKKIWEKVIYKMSVLAHLFIVLGFDSSDDIQIWVSLNNTHLGCRAVEHIT